MIGIYVVLAAGRGRRMGGPKALLQHHGETLLAHHVHAAQLARLAGPICVTGAEAERVEAAHGEYPIQFVRSADPDAPMMDSVRLGLAAVPKANVAYLTPVDVLPPRIDTFDLLAEALESASPEVVALRPRMRGKSGHPVILLPEAIAALLEGGGVQRLDAWLREKAAAGAVRDVDVDDYNVLSNFNSPNDLPAP